MQKQEHMRGNNGNQPYGQQNGEEYDSSIEDGEEDTGEVLHCMYPGCLKGTHRSLVFHVYLY
jgi:hypothetical protein